MRYALSFPTGSVEYLFDEPYQELELLAPPKNSIVVTDENVVQILPEALQDYPRIVFPAGERAKCWDNIAGLAEQLMGLEAHRHSFLLGVGGGVVTDITGFLASVYMRGIGFGYIPTSLLGMVDASIGGKNGVNHKGHKNMLGTFRQPSFIWYDTALLRTLPNDEWANGFAEIIKYGFIADSRILNTLASNEIRFFQNHPQQLSDLIAGCVDVKNKIVHADEKESGLRMRLNFGHTAGHAFEALYGLPHGQAVGLGMIVACLLSEEHTSLSADCAKQLRALLQQYGLPQKIDFSIDDVVSQLRLDKKRKSDAVDFVLLEKPGVATVKTLSFDEIRRGLQLFADEGGY